MKSFYCILTLFLIPAVSFCQLHKLLKEIGEGDEDGFPNYVALTFWKDKIYFLGDWTGPGQGYSIWTTDGTTENTLELTSAYKPNDIIAINDYVLFDSYTNNASQLYRTNGTEAGIDIVKGSFQGNINLMTSLNENQILFIDETGFPHDSLWVSDGTTSGTFALGEYKIIPLWTTATKFGSRLIFSDNSGNAQKFPPIISDGTIKGTKLVEEYVGTENVSTAVGTNSFIFFKTNVESDSGMVFNGSGTSDIILPGDLFKAYSIGPINFVFTKTSIIVYNAFSDSAYQLPVTPLYNTGYVWAEPISFNNKIYFYSSDKILFESDGAPAGTRQIATTTIADREPYLFGWNNTIFYNAAEGNNLVIRAFDLSSNVDTIFSLVHPGIFSGNLVSYINHIGERILYKTFANDRGREWYVYDPFLTSIVNETNLSTLKLLPNPAKDELFIQQADRYSTGELVIYNAAGQLSMKEFISGHMNQLNIQHLPPGKYSVFLTEKEGQQYFGSFIKQ